ncbi:MAG: DMT family transporter [Bacillota bacterium]
MRTYIILSIAILLNAGANIMIKAAMKKSPIILEQGAILQAFAQAIKNPHLIAGVALFGLALAAYSVVLSRINLSVAYPIMTGAGFLLVFLVSALYFKENITAVHILGSTLILMGVWVLGK